MADINITRMLSILLLLLLNSFKEPFFQDNCVSQHQKVRTIVDFNEARDDKVAVAAAEPYAIHLHLAQDR